MNSMFGSIFYPEFLLTEEFAAHSIFYKYGYALCTLKLKIFTYYTAFCLIETGTVASGMSFNGYNEKRKILLNVYLILEKVLFNRVTAVRVWDIEFSYRVKDFLDAWNISVHLWLKYYVYLRLLKRDKKGI